MPPARWCAAGAIGSQSTAGSSPAAARLADSVGNLAANSSSPVASSHRCADVVARHLDGHRTAHDVARARARRRTARPAASRSSAPWPAQRLGEQRARHRGMVQRRRVELHELDVGDGHAGAQREGEAVARSPPVGFVVTSKSWPTPPVASTTVRRLELVAARVASRTATPRHTPVLDEQVDGDRVLADLARPSACVASTSARSTSAPVAAPPACRIRACECPPSRARCSAPDASRSNTAPSAMSSSTRRRPLVDEHAHRVHVAQPRARLQRVGEVAGRSSPRRRAGPRRRRPGPSASSPRTAPPWSRRPTLTPASASRTATDSPATPLPTTSTSTVTAAAPQTAATLSMSRTPLDDARDEEPHARCPARGLDGARSVAGSTTAA